MNIEGKKVLVLGGGGMVGQAVCRELLAQQPARLVIASRRKSKACATEAMLKSEYPNTATQIIPVWGDVFLRAEWQNDGESARASVLTDTQKRRRLIGDIIDPLNEDIVTSSLLVQFILGSTTELGGVPSHIIADCMNTATAVSYQDVYTMARRLSNLAQRNEPQTDWPMEVESLLASLSVPQLVRHVQLLYEAMRRANTQAYVKIGTSGTGGMGFNIPFTHGEEKPSRLLLSKTSMAGAQSLLNFLMARTPDAPAVVKEIKPAALIGWKAIQHGTIHRRDLDVTLYDCLPENAVSIQDTGNLVSHGNFGESTGQALQGVFIDTGENGKFSASEFSVITALGLMELVTPEEVAKNAVRELIGTNTGRDIIAALDSSVMEPSYRGGYLRQTALQRLRQLEAKHGEAVAFEILGPPRLSKLLFEAYLLKRTGKNLPTVIDDSAENLAQSLQTEIYENNKLRQRIISIGIPILLADGEHLLRGPIVKSEDAYHGWVDLTAVNMEIWQNRLHRIYELISTQLNGDTSSHHDRLFYTSRLCLEDKTFPDIGEIVAWIFIQAEQGARGKY